jgi:hypothetical protein
MVQNILTPHSSLFLFMSLQIQKYTDKSIVIRGDTKSRINDIKAISGAKFGYYGGEPGWMFPLTMEQQVRSSLGLRSAYVDGPKPISRGESPGTSSYTRPPASQPSHVEQDVAGSKPVVRGALRGRAPVDPEESEVKDAEIIANLQSTVAKLLVECKSLREAFSEIKEKCAVLESRLDEIVVEEEVVEE